MKIRSTLILFGLLLAALGTFGLFQLLKVRTAKEKEAGRRFVLPSLNDEARPVKATDISSILIERQNPETKQPEKLQFERENNQWRMVAPRKLRVDDAAVTALVSQIQSLRREDAKLNEGLAAYGLDKPTVTVHLQKGAERHVLQVGSEGPAAADPLLYVSSSDRPGTPVAVKKSQVNKLLAPLGDFRQKQLFTTSFGINEVKLAGKNRKPLHLAKQSETQWLLKDPALGDADLSAVNATTLDLTNLRVEKNADFVHDAPSAELLKKHGLTNEDAAFVVTLSHPAAGDATKTVTETLLVGQVDPSAAAAGDAEKAAQAVAGLVAMASFGPAAVAPAAHLLQRREGTATEARFAMKVGDDAIVRLSEKQLEPLRKAANELRAKNLVALDASQIDAIDLLAHGETLRFRRANLKPDASQPAEWFIYSDSRARVPAQGSKVRELIDALNKVTAKDANAFLEDPEDQRRWFGAETVDLGLNKPQAEVTLWLAGLQRDAEGKVTGTGEPTFKEAAKDKPAAKVAIGRRDPKRNVVYVRRELPDQKPVIVALPDPWQPAAPPAFPGGPPPQPTTSISLSEVAGAGYLAYRDHSLPSLRPLDVTQLSIERPSGALELKRQENKGTEPAGAALWNIVKPFEAKAPLAEVLVNALTGLGAERLVTDRATDRDLDEKFGLGAKPLMKFTLKAPAKAAGKVDEHVYLIGKKTEASGKHPNHWYARLMVTPGEGPAPDSNQLVFLINQAELQMLDGEVRDTVVFPGEASLKPASLTLTWHHVDPAKKRTETRLELALADDKKSWYVKALTVDGKDEKSSLPLLDQAKLNLLVGLPIEGRVATEGPRLSPLVAERFLQALPAAAELRLDPANKELPPRLLVDLVFEGGTKRSLVVGANFEPNESDLPGWVGRRLLVASASSLPNTVFLLGELEWKGLLAGPQFFKPSDAAN